MSELLHEIVNTALTWLTDLGYWGIMLGLMIEIIPSEIVLAFGGYLVHQGEINYWLAVVFGTVGGVIAQIFVYWIGRYGGRPVLERFGKYIFINKHHIEVSENWFNKYGTGVIFTARFIPVVRHAISVPAGLARMPLSKFTILTTLAVIPWSMLFIYLGMTLGENWKQIDEKAAQYMDELMWGALVLTVLYAAYVIFKRRRRKAESPDVHPAAKTEESIVDAGSLSGSAGQSGLDDALRSLGGEYRVEYDCELQSGKTSLRVDRLVVGPNGVFHIDVKTEPGDLRFAAAADERTDGAGSKEGPTAAAYRQQYALKEMLRREGITADVVGIVCAAHPDARIVGESPAFAALKPDGLAAYIRSHRAKEPLDPKRIEEIVRLVGR